MIILSKKIMENIMFIKKNPFANNPLIECGSFNGYVAVPPTNKYYGKSDVDLYGICVHGGVTYSEPLCDNFLKEEMSEMGVDTANERNGILDGAIFLDGVQDVPNDWWIIGFDTCHDGDTPQKWTKEKVIAETRNLNVELLK